MKKLPIALVMALSAVVAVAQEGAPAGAPKKAAAPAAAQDAAKPAALDAAAEAWVKTLAAKIADGNTVIRDSSVAAIEKVGKPALPVLNALATGTDKALADAAKKLAERIEKGQTGQDRRGMMAGGQMKTVDDVAKELKLDDKKTEQLKELQKTAQDKMREMMEAMRSGELSREEMMSEMQAFRDELKGDLRKFLSEDEAKKVEESLGGSIMGGRGMGGGRGGQGGGGGGGGRRGGGGGGV